METLTKYFTASYKLSQADIFNEIDADKDIISLSKDGYIKLDPNDGKWLFHCASGDYYFKTVEEIIELLTSN